ncbi:hypothetical protein CR103_19935 [Massilia psychrophila]|uniref:DUF3047 domain-containing protein n=2 Tax=Massilia psychrophila TaxID=1603353 RepID=A0A2G8SWC5_9BURK|nr:hypothetical protein CR103_19935 [Massilia psychrophila]
MKARMATVFAGTMAFVSVSAVQASPPVPAFSSMAPAGEIFSWLPLKPAPKAPATRYSLVGDGGATVVHAQADRSMSGLIHTLRVDTRRYPRLRWRWKIGAPVAAADMTRKDGDDYAARVYVMFDYPLERLGFGTRMKLMAGEALYGQKLPTATLNYVWDNRQPTGTMRANAYTDRARMIVLRSGPTEAGTWVTETRDLRADFRAAFGEEAPDVVALAIATDTDNTGSRAEAWYGDLQFLPPEKRPPQ